VDEVASARHSYLVNSGPFSILENGQTKHDICATLLTGRKFCKGSLGRMAGRRKQFGQLFDRDYAARIRHETKSIIKTVSDLNMGLEHTKRV